MNYPNQPVLSLQSLDEFITALSTEDPSKFNQIIRSLELPSNAFDGYSSWCEDSYTRNCIADNEKFELILLCWEKGQITPIHDHGGEECWVKVIEGEFRETIYVADEAGELKVLKTSVAQSNDVTYMIDFMGFHTLENLSNQKSMSLHLYAKPIRSCNVFDKDSQQFVHKHLAYDTNAQLVAI